MHPLVKGAVVAAVLTALGNLEARPAAPPPSAAPSLSIGAVPGGGLTALCGARTVPDGAICVPVPDVDAPLPASAEANLPARAAHVSRRRGYEEYDQIPRRPDRAEDHARYRWPIGGDAPPRVLSGYDLDQPADRQRQGAGFADTGHGGVDLAATRGEPVSVAGLEHQEGEAEVIFVGELFGVTVITSHTVREAGRLRQYLVVYGHLERPGVVAGARAKEGTLIGWAGDTGSPGVVHLHLEVRQVREGVAVTRESKKLVDPSVSVACDPRNALVPR
ncbi:MAG: M23 family metallopeptidase [Polyangiaceae bacterium]